MHLARHGLHSRPCTRPNSHHHRLVIMHAHNKGQNYYELLGVTKDASDEEIKAGFRRRAKELHPDVNPEEDTNAAFIEVSEAYNTLSDRTKRAEYDRVHGLRRMNFFTDVEEDEYGDPVSPFRYSSARPGDSMEDLFRRSRGGGGDAHDKAAETGRSGFGWSDVRGRRRRGGQGVDEDGGAEEEPDDEEIDAALKEAERLEKLMQFMTGMGPDGLSRRWQRSDVDFWGNSTTDSWARRVQQQTQEPFGRGRPVGGQDWGRPGRGPEWRPPGRRWGDAGEDDEFDVRRTGWVPPGRRDEWGRPRPGDDELDDGRPGRSGTGRGRPGWGGDGGFKGTPL